MNEKNKTKRYKKDKSLKYSSTQSKLPFKMHNLLKDKRSKAILSIILVSILLIGTFCYLVLADEPEPESVLWKRTATTDTYKNPDGTYTKVLHSGVVNVYEDKVWKSVENARSLKNSWDVVYLENDTVHLIDVLDFNYTSITLNFSYDENSPDISEFEYELEDGKMKTKYKIIRINETGDEYEEEIEIEIEEGEFQGYVLYENPLGKKFKLGENSTTVTLQDANTENLEDACVQEGFPNTNYGSSNFLRFDDSGNSKEFFLKFSLDAGDIFSVENASLGLYVRFNDLDAGEEYNVSVNHLVNQSWEETFPTFNNRGTLGVINYTNNTLIFDSSTSGWVYWNVTSIVKEENDNSNINASFYFLGYTSGGNPSNEEVEMASKEYSTSSQRPKLIMEYIPYVDITSPTPSQIFTEAQPTSIFNVTTSVDTDECYWSPNNGTSNYTMTRVNATTYGVINTSMVDGTSTVEVQCNQSSDGTWRISDDVTFDVDSINITTCRDLTVSNREYKLQSHLSSISSNCLDLTKNGIVVDGNGYNINGLGTGEDICIDSFANYVNNTIAKKINSTNCLDLVSSSGVNESLIDSIGNGSSRISSDTGTLNVVNVTGVIDFTTDGNLTRKWYFQIQVNDSSGYLKDATVNIYDKNGVLYSELTNATGEIAIKELVEYDNVGGTKEYYNLFSVNISKGSYDNNDTLFNLTDDQNIMHYVTMTSSASDPVTLLSSPVNDSNLSLSVNTLKCNSTDANGNLNNVTFYTWFSGTVENTTTETNITGASGNATASITFTNQGAYEWNCYTCDVLHACSWDDNETINIDTYNPNITINIPDDNSNVTTQQNLTVNITDDGGIKNITLHIVNTANTTINTTTQEFGDGIVETFFGIIYNFVDGFFKWFYTVSDWAGNTNSSANHSITVDSTAPSVNIVFPSNDTAHSNNISINWTATDATGGLDSCWWSDDEGDTNYTMTPCGQNASNNFTDGNYFYLVYANDTLGNVGEDSVTFSISFGPPAVQIDSPVGNAFLSSGTDIYFNYTATDGDGLNTCQLWSNWTGAWGSNYTWFLPNSGKMNWTTQNITEGRYDFAIECNDSLSSSTITNNRTFEVDLTVPVTTQSHFSPTTVYNESDLIIYGNITDKNLDTVWIQLNTSTDYTNTTVTTKVGDQYYYTVDNTLIDNFENISWFWYANDSAGNENTTGVKSITVTNRDPTNATIDLPLNASYVNAAQFINFSADDADQDVLNFTLYNSTDGLTYSIYNSTNITFMNFTGFTTDGVTHYFYLTVNDSDSQNFSQLNYTIFVDKVNPDLTSIAFPEASPTALCTRTDVSLNYSVSDTNLDYCIFNVTHSTGVIQTPQTTISGCSNVTFNITNDNDFSILNFKVVDKAGNENSSQTIINIDSTDASCVAPTTPGGGGGGGRPETERPDLFCGDGICSSDRESFYNCPEDCTTLEFPTFEELLFNCVSEDAAVREDCFWADYSGLLLVFGFISSFIIFNLFFEVKPENKGFKKLVRRQRWKKTRKR